MPSKHSKHAKSPADPSTRTRAVQHFRSTGANSTRRLSLLFLNHGLTQYPPLLSSPSHAVSYQSRLDCSRGAIVDGARFVMRADPNPAVGLGSSSVWQPLKVYSLPLHRSSSAPPRPLTDELMPSIVISNRSPITRPPRLWSNFPREPFPPRVILAARW